MEEIGALLKDYGLPIVVLILLFVGKYLRLGREVEREQQITKECQAACDTRLSELSAERDEWKKLAMNYMEQWSTQVLPAMQSMTQASEKMLRKTRRPVNDG